MMVVWHTEWRVSYCTGVKDLVLPELLQKCSALIGMSHVSFIDKYGVVAMLI